MQVLMVMVTRRVTTVTRRTGALATTIGRTVITATGLIIITDLGPDIPGVVIMEAAAGVAADIGAVVAEMVIGVVVAAGVEDRAYRTLKMIRPNE